MIIWKQKRSEMLDSITITDFGGDLGYFTVPQWLKHPDSKRREKIASRPLFHRAGRTNELTFVQTFGNTKWAFLDAVGGIVITKYM